MNPLPGILLQEKGRESLALILFILQKVGNQLLLVLALGLQDLVDLLVVLQVTEIKLDDIVMAD